MKKKDKINLIIIILTIFTIMLFISISNNSEETKEIRAKQSYKYDEDCEVADTYIR